MADIFEVTPKVLSLQAKCEYCKVVSKNFTEVRLEEKTKRPRKRKRFHFLEIAAPEGEQVGQQAIAGSKSENAGLQNIVGLRIYRERAGNFLA